LLGFVSVRTIKERSIEGVCQVSLARGGVINQCPIATVALVADEKVESGEHRGEKTPELQEGVALVRVPVDVRELGPVGLGRKDEGLARHVRPAG